MAITRTRLVHHNQNLISDWTEFTPTFNNVTFGTTSVFKWYYRTIGNLLEITGNVQQTGAGTTTGIVELVLPNNFEIDTSVGEVGAGGGARNRGDGFFEIGTNSTSSEIYQIRMVDSTTLDFRNEDLSSSRNLSNTSSANFSSSGARVSTWIRVPIKL